MKKTLGVTLNPSHKKKQNVSKMERWLNSVILNVHRGAVEHHGVKLALCALVGPLDECEVHWSWKPTV